MLFRKKSFTSQIFGSKMQKSTVLKKNVSTVQLLSNESADDFILF